MDSLYRSWALVSCELGMAAELTVNNNVDLIVELVSFLIASNLNAARMRDGGKDR